MLKAVSALAGAARPGVFGARTDAPGLKISERRGLLLIQVAAWENSFPCVRAAICKNLRANAPPQPGRAAAFERGHVFQTSPTRFLLVCHGVGCSGLDDIVRGLDATIVDLSHSRTVLRISGPDSRTFLNRGLPIDLRSEKFPVNGVAMSSIRDVSVLLHRTDGVAEDSFDLFIPRSLARWLWSWLFDSAQQFGVVVDSQGQA